MEVKYLMNKIEKEYLQTTRDILVGYDGEHTVEGLKKLIDETRERLEKALHGEIKDEDLSMTEEQFEKYFLKQKNSNEG
jgi:hypothetical protein